MILITGGLGYLGGRIAQYLVNSGKKVVLGTRSVGISIPDELIDCDIVKIDMEDSRSLQDACNGVKTVIHLAGMDSNKSMLDPKKAILINGNGTLNLLNAAKSAKVEQFLFFSTVHVYKSPLIGLIDEDSATIPSHPYSISNQIAENHVIDASKNGDLNSTIFRLSNAVGRPLNKDVNCWSLVTNDLCKAVVINGQLKLNSNSQNQRDFISISDICKAVLFFLDRGQLLTSGEIYNLSTGYSTSLDELTQLIVLRSKKILGFSPKVTFNYSKNTDSPMDLNISNKKIKNLGCNFTGSIIEEVDGLLSACSKWFLNNK